MNRRYNFTFYFRAHATAADNRRYPELLQSADLLIPEVTARPDWFEVDLQKLSAGTITLDEFATVHGANAPGSSTWYSDQYLAGSGIPIVVIDRTLTPVMQARKRVPLQNWITFIKSCMAGDRSKAVENCLVYGRYQQKELDERDLISHRNLWPKITQAERQFPQLANKAEVNILLTYGLSHTPLFHKLKRYHRNGTVRRVFNRPTESYGAINALVRRLRFIDRYLTDAPVENILLESSVEAYLNQLKIFADTQERLDVARRIISSYDPSNLLTDVYEYLQKCEDESIRWWRAVINTAISKGLIIPQTFKPSITF